MLTPAEREEGRRLLGKYRQVPPVPGYQLDSRALAWWKWIEANINALLAETPDPESIAREAVREFAEAVEKRLEGNAGAAVDRIDRESDPSLRHIRALTANLWFDCVTIMRQLARERGVELNTNQQPRSEK